MDPAARDEKYTAYKLGVKVQTLRNWRHLGKGPAYLKIGERMVRYLDEDIDAFKLAKRITPRAA